MTIGNNMFTQVKNRLGRSVYVAYANQKGGVGKSTLSVNHAEYMAWLGGRVAIIDMDKQANSSSTLAQYQVGRSIDLWSEGYELPELESEQKIFLFSATKSAIEDVNPLAMLAGLDDLERMAPFVANVMKLADQVDLVIFDCAPTSDVKMLAALAAADFVACPIELEQYAIDGIGEMIDSINWSKEYTNPNLQFLGMIANKVNPQSRAQYEAFQALHASFDTMILPVKVGMRVAIGEACNERTSIFKMKKPSAKAAAQELQNVFDQLHTKMMEA